jgi:hypothetical protein
MAAENHLLKKDAAIAQVSLLGEVFMHGKETCLFCCPFLFFTCHHKAKISCKSGKYGDKMLVTVSAHFTL